MLFDQEEALNLYLNFMSSDILVISSIKWFLKFSN